VKPHDPRFLRQLLLPEIGEEGQRRILSAELCLPPDLAGPAREVALLYGLGAGLKEPESGAARMPEPAFLPAHFHHEEAREVARGAHLALLSLRSAVSVQNAVSLESALGTGTEVSAETPAENDAPLPERTTAAP